MILRPFFIFSNGGFPAPAASNLELTVDGTLINVPDTFLAAYPLAPVITTNGYTVVVDTDVNGNLGNLKISINTLKVWESVTVRIRNTKALHETYDQTFVVYGYDLGNTIGGGGVNGNPTFSIFQIGTAIVGTAPSVGVIAYRKPFTDRLYYYRSTADGNTCQLFDSTSGTDVALGSTGFINNNSETVTIKCYNPSGATATINATCLKKVWIAPFTLSASTNCPDDDCFTPLSTNTASIVPDYSLLSTVFLNDVEVYPYNNQGLTYNLYRYDGTLLASKFFGFTISVPFVFPALTYDWVGFNIPEAGSYILEGCISAWEDITTNILTADDLIEGQWYSIKSNGGGADWTNLGAPNNNVDTEFMATSSGAPTDWGTGELYSIDKIYECCKREPIKGCNFATIQQTDCSKYLIKNICFDATTVVIAAMNQDQGFDTITTVSLLQGETYEFVPSTDNVYTVTITNEVTADVFIQVIVADCELKECALDYIGKTICACKPEHACGDFCQDFYDYNAFIILSHTYFNMLNSLYSLDFMFTTLSETKVEELYTIKQVLDRIKEYCGNCDSCSKPVTKCSCND